MIQLVCDQTALLHLLRSLVKLVGGGPIPEIEADPEGFVEHVRALVAERPAMREEGRPGEEGRRGGVNGLRVGLEASWVAGPDGVRHPLGLASRRIVMALLERHRHAPGAVLTTGELLAAGWPGERLIPRAGQNRVYVALARLRRVGLADVIERTEGGYRIAPGAAVRLSAS